MTKYADYICPECGNTVNATINSTCICTGQARKKHRGNPVVMKKVVVDSKKQKGR